MTIREAIDRANNLQFNTYTDAEKINWLSRLDERVALLVLDTGSADGQWYAKDVDTDTALLVPSPFDEMYIYWLMAQMSFANGEIEKYNNAIALYNTEYEAYEKWYHRNRTIRPEKRGHWRM